MIQSIVFGVCILFLTMEVLEAQRQNCGGKFPDCPDGQFCAPPGRGVFGVKGQHKCYACPCAQTSQCYFDLDGEIKCDCGTNFTGEYCETPVVSDCGSLPDFGPHVEVNITYYAIGSSFLYTCTPCTFFVDINVASGTITCQADGTWSTPTCVSALDVGYLVGCESCYQIVYGGFKMDGSIRICYCEPECCFHQSCCYNYDGACT